jgi:hypothetical protein
MTTIDKTEVIANALAALEALRQLDICDPLELTRPFRQFAAQLNIIGGTLQSVGFAATIDDDVRRRVENVLDEMEFASRLIETAAGSALSPSSHFASTAVRTWFEAALTLPAVRSSLTSNEVLLGIEPTLEEVSMQVDAEIAETRDAIMRGDIIVPRTKDA